MAKTKISEFSSTAGNNTDIDSINISEGCAPSGINNAIRELMAQLKDFQAGTAGDSFNGPVGTTTAAAGAFTNLTASGTLGVTGATTLSAALTYGGVTLSNAVTGTGNMVLSASPTLTGTLSGANASLSGTLAVTGVATLTAQPILSSLTASRAVFTDGSKGLVSNAITGTGNVVMSASPTLTGTITAEALTTSGTVTLNGGTANGVAYLNGSKVLTTGSALVFDGANLGIGTSSPAFRLDAVNNVAGLARYSFSNPNAGMTQTDLRVGAGTNSNDLFLGVQSGNAFIDTRGTNLVLVFQRSGTELMRLDSTGLGIGTSSPTNKLSVSGNANITGNTTLGDASTDTVTVNGYMGVGATPAANIGIRVARTLTGNSQEWGVYADPTFDSSATSIGGSVGSKPATAAASFTVSNIFGFRALDATKGAGSTITNLHGLYIDDQTQGTNNYGITSLVSSGTNKWNIYASGTAQNYFAGNVQFAAGSAAAPALTRFGDDNTGMFFPAADTIAFAEGGTEVMRIDSSGNVGIGTSSPSASAILDAQSTTKGVRMPNMTTTQKNAIASPAAGLMVFDTTLSKLCVYTGAAWQTITSA